MERSGVIREAFRALGHDAWSCDLASAEDGSQFHHQGDLFDVLDEYRYDVDMVIVHPECTYLSSSGLHWNKRRPERVAKTDAALMVVARLMRYALDFPCLKFCLENPDGCISTRLPDLDRHFGKQRIQPYNFGEDASKLTVLRLRNVPPLMQTKRVPGRMVMHNGKMVERWSNQTDSGQNRLGPSEKRWMDRSRTFHGIADAMADQWGHGAISLGKRRTPNDEVGQSVLTENDFEDGYVQGHIDSGLVK